MQVFFLEADVALTKRFKKFPTRVETTSYPLVSKFTSHGYDIDSLEALFDMISYHGEQGHCLLKGALQRDLVDESRAGATASSAETSWVCLDIDGLPVSTPDDAMQLLGMGDISYIAQYSSSYRIRDDMLRCHIFMLLDRAAAAPLLKQWLIDLNFSIDALRENLVLSQSQNFLHWPLDITTCQNDKLLYIAPPVLTGLESPVEDRYELRMKDKLAYSLPAHIPNPAANRKRIDDHLNSLREAAGLPKRRAAKYSHSGPIEFMANPEQAMVTGTKEDRGFMYLNLNGGDSWAYYHPVGKFEFIFNFKGEPAYRTENLVPDYYHQCLAEQEESIDAGEQTMHLAFRDFHTAQYFNGFFYPSTQNLELARAGSEKQLSDFMTQHGRVMPEVVPIWRMEFLPEEDWIVDRKSQRINTFIPTPYIRREANKRVKKIPPTILKIIDHALGNDEECVKHFVNWLATAVQTKRAIGTAWVLSGTQGTGKGLLCHRILSPIIGHSYVVQKRMDELSEKFNDYMRQTLMLFVDEVTLADLHDGGILMQRIKNLITEEVISVRPMHSAPIMVPNYMNWILASNATNPVILDVNDRRFNVATFQPNRLDISSQEIQAIDGELQAFADYLRLYPASADLARKLLMTEQRMRLIATSTTSIDHVCHALLTGDLQFFLDELPTDSVAYLDPRQQMRLRLYKEVLADIVDRNPKVISRDALRVLLDYVVADLPGSSQKFTSMLRHRGIFIEPVKLGRGETVRGVRTAWAVPPNAKRQMAPREALPPAEAEV